MKLTRCLLFIALLAILATGCRKKSPDDILADAVKAYQRGDMVGATVKSEDLIKKYPESKAALNARMLLATTQMKSGDPTGARKTLGEIIQQAGIKSEMGQMAYINRLGTFKQPAEIIAEIAKTSASLSVAPEFSREVQERLAALYFQNKQPEKAEAHLRAMLKNASKEEDAFPAMESLVAMLMQQGKYNDALAVYQDRLAKSANSKNKGSLLFGIGVMHQQLAKAAKDPASKASEEKAVKESMAASEEAFTKQLQAEPLERNKVSLMIQLSRVYRTIGDDKKADNYLESQITKTTKPEVKQTILSELADAYFMRKDYAKAKQYLMQLAKAFPDQELGKLAMGTINRIDAMMAKSAATTGTLKTAPAAAQMKSTETAPVAKPASEAAKTK